MRFHVSILPAGIALLAVHVMMLAPGTAFAQEQCSNKTTKGKYLVVCDGYLSPGQNAPLVPAKLLGTVIADNSGTFRSTAGQLTIGGTVVHQEVVGIEALNADCTGTITYTQTVNGKSAPPITFFFVVTKDGDKIDGLGSDPGTVFSCRLSRISRRDE